MNVEQSIEVAAPPETVWAVITDVEGWPEWTASVTSVERLDDGPFRAGSRARIRQPRFPAVVWEVTELDPGRAFTWEARSTGVHTVATHHVAPGGDGASTVVLAVRSSGFLVALLRPWLARITARYVDMEARGLKQRSESIVGAGQ